MIVGPGGVRYIEFSDALRLIEREGIGPVADKGTLEGQLGRPMASFDGADAFPEMHQKAAALLHGLARTQTLVDGNKRLAAACTVAFYRINGYAFEADQRDFADYVLSVANAPAPVAVDSIAIHLTLWARDLADELAPDDDPHLDE